MGGDTVSLCKSNILAHTKGVRRASALRSPHPSHHPSFDANCFWTRGPSSCELQALDHLLVSQRGKRIERAHTGIIRHTEPGAKIPRKPAAHSLNRQVCIVSIAHRHIYIGSGFDLVEEVVRHRSWTDHVSRLQTRPRRHAPTFVVDTESSKLLSKSLPPAKDWSTSPHLLRCAPFVGLVTLFRAIVRMGLVHETTCTRGVASQFSRNRTGWRVVEHQRKHLA